MPDIEIGARRPAQLRESKVESSVGGARLRQHDVGGLDVAVRDPRAMRFIERVGDLGRDLQRLIERQRTFRSARVVRPAFRLRGAP